MVYNTLKLDPRLEAQIRQNLEIVQHNISKCAALAGRPEKDIKLVVVTKTHPVNILRCVINAGVRDLGENYAEEAIEKMDTLGNAAHCSWHMIGHVQSRKAGLIAQYFDYMHSLDSIKLARRINQHAMKMDQILPVLLEINVGGEESKSGWRLEEESRWDNIFLDIETVVNLSNLRVLGLMTIPPYTPDPEAARPYFKKLRLFAEYLRKHFQQVEWKELSMGMSGDYQVAIEEGATWVRIGQAILGPRTI